MKPIIYLIILFLSLSKTNLIAQDSLSISDKIVSFAIHKLNKKIDRGECWDLVAKALNETGANWNSPDEFGRKLNLKNDSIIAGDIIAFENVVFEVKKQYKMTFPHHYAIVTKVINENKIEIAHQNYAGKKTVGLLELNLNEKTRGKTIFYRPLQ